LGEEMAHEIGHASPGCGSAPRLHRSGLQPLDPRVLARGPEDL